MKVPELQVALAGSAGKEEFFPLKVEGITCYIHRELKFKGNRMLVEVTGLGPFKQVKVSRVESFF